MSHLREAVNLIADEQENKDVDYLQRILRTAEDIERVVLDSIMPMVELLTNMDDEENLLMANNSLRSIANQLGDILNMTQFLEERLKFRTEEE